MAFKRTQKPTFTTPVVVNVPNGRGGFDKNTFVAEFKRPTNDESAALRALNLTPAELVRRQLVGWELKDEETSEDVPFNAAELEALLQIEPTPLSTAVAFWETVNGARSKN